jgi:hypothetical protein
MIESGGGVLEKLALTLVHSLKRNSKTPPRKFPMPALLFRIRKRQPFYEGLV